MKTYSVDLQYINYVTLFVQAETEAQAKILAWKEVETLQDDGYGEWDTLDVEEWIPEAHVAQAAPSADWSKTTAEFNGEDWFFENVPLEVCPEWRGSTCFGIRDLGVREDATPEQAIAALKDWLSTP
jgi:hypothetical protein